MSKHYIPKLTVELEEDQYWRLKNHLGYGELRPLMSAIVDDIIDMIDTHGTLVIALIAGKQVLPRDVIPSLNKAIQTMDTLRETDDDRSK